LGKGALELVRSKDENWTKTRRSGGRGTSRRTNMNKRERQKGETHTKKKSQGGVEGRGMTEPTGQKVTKQRRSGAQKKGRDGGKNIS